MGIAIAAVTLMIGTPIAALSLLGVWEVRRINKYQKGKLK
jgi:hypothetical protein